jgi:ubiquinone/menaquinone biosynthesis C-methylase UbiE
MTDANLGSSGGRKTRSACPSGHVGETLSDLPGLTDALLASGGTFVELGAGYGARLRTLLDSGAMKGFSRIIVTDLSAERMQFARSLLPEAEVIVCDAQSLPFESGSVDFVFSDQVIEHVESDAAMAREIYRVLRADGQAYVGSVLRRPWGWYFYRNNGRWRLDPTHVREYESLAQYASVFEGAGFTTAAISNAQTSFPVGESMLRPLVRIGALSGGSTYDVHGRSRLLRMLSKIRIPIPGYHGCWVRLRK